MREARRDEPSETFGSYVLYECLGRGGMATVHRAAKTGIEGFERPVALKRMLPWLSADPEFVKSFVREARLAAQLRHVNIAQVYDLGKADGIYYIAMELVRGRDLREILRHAHNVVGPMPVPAVINLMFQLCDALDYAHTFRDEQGRQLGLVHRDISPANIIVGEDGIAKLVDFGVAKGTTATLATQSGMLKGKFAYMSPEMLHGHVDARSDLFAVGVVAWEMLTAKPLFAGGDDMEILQRVTGWDPPPPSSVTPSCPPDLDAWVQMALAKNPDRRFHSAAQMRAGLELVARVPAMRATNGDVAGWIAWAFSQQVGHAVVEPPAPGTIQLDEASIEYEVERHNTAIGTAPPPRQTPQAYPAQPTPAAPAHHSTLHGNAVPAPIVIPPSSGVPQSLVVPASGAVPAAAANAARTVLYEGVGPAAHPHGGHGPPAPVPGLPAQPPGAGPGAAPPLSSMVPTVAPGQFMAPPPAAPHAAGPVAMPTAPLPGWGARPRPAPAQVALHGEDMSARPEYLAANAAYHQGAVRPPTAEEPAPPAAAVARGTPHPQPVAERPASKARDVIDLPPPPPSSSAGTILVLVLCAAAAVGGFFLVQQLM